MPNKEQIAHDITISLLPKILTDACIDAADAEEVVSIYNGMYVDVFHHLEIEEKRMLLKMQEKVEE